MARPGKGEKTPGSGRAKGVKNKDYLPLEEKAKELGIDPYEVLLLFVKGDWEALGYDNLIIEKNTQFGTSWEYTISPGVRMKAAAEACSYLYSKRKAIEHSVDPALQKTITCLLKSSLDDK